MAYPVLFIQGGSDGAYRTDAILAAALRRQLGSGFEVRYPAMPNEDEPDYETWKAVILDEVRNTGGRIVLVGHSIGGSVLIKIATEGLLDGVGGVLSLAAPFWHDHQFWRWDEVALSVDAAERYPRDVPLFLYHGQADDVVPLSHLDMYAKALPHAFVRALPGRDHQFNDDMTEVARDLESLT